MKRAILRAYLKYRYKIALTALYASIATIMVVLTIQLLKQKELEDDIHRSKFTYLIEQDFNLLCSRYFSDNSVASRRVESCISHFNNHNCVVLIYNNRKLEYCSDNVYIDCDALLANTHSKKQYLTINGCAFFQLSHERGGVNVVLLANSVEHYNRLVSDNLFANVTLTNLLYGGLLLLMLSLSILISNYCHLERRIVVIVVSYILISLLIIAVDILNVIDNVTWIVGLQALIFSSMLAVAIRRVVSVSLHKISAYRALLFSYVLVIIASTLLLCYYTIFLLDSDNSNISIIDIAPIAAFALAHINIILGYNALVSSHNRGVYNLIYIICVALVAVMLSLFNYEFAILFVTLSLATLISLFGIKWLSSMKIFYLFIVLISLIGSYMLFSFDTVSIYGEDLTIFSYKDKSISLYSMPIESTTIRECASATKINHFVTIFIYVFLTYLGIGVILINRKLFNVNINGDSSIDKVWRTVYISIYVAIIAIVLLGKGFARNIREEFSKLYVNGISSSVAIDYTYNDGDIVDWLSHIQNVYSVSVDIYSENGDFIVGSQKGGHSSRLRPKQLASGLLSYVRGYSEPCFINSENFQNNIHYIAAYIPTDDHLILRIPYNSNFLVRQCSPIVTKFTNVFVMVILVFIIFLTVSYYKQISPLRFIKKNIFKIKSHDKIFIPRDVKSSYEVTYLLNEYNNIINELLERHTLQMIGERQVLYNRTMRMVAHEIKNPLTPMLMMSQLALRKIENNYKNRDETVVRALNTVVEQTNIISKLISKMMKDSVNFSINSSSGSVIPLLKEMVQFYSVYSEITIVIENQTPEINLETKINARDLWSVVSNITSNAIDAIRLRSSLGGNVWYMVSCRKDMMILKIRNNGVPILEADLDDIFKYNFTTKDDGNGLGLFLANQIIKYAEGKIYISTSNQDYTEFVIELPIIL